MSERKRCPNCKFRFRTQRSDQVYCCKQCRNAMWERNKRNPHYNEVDMSAVSAAVEALGRIRG